MHGPRYVLTEDGDAVYRGHFDDDEEPEAAVSGIRPKLKPILLTTFLRRFTNSETDENAVSLMVAIVDASRDLAKSRFPASEFHVIFWDDEQPSSGKLLAGLEQKEIRVHRISDILTEYRSDPFRYRLHERDRHPNGLTHRMVADYIGREIIGSCSTPPS